MNDWQIAGAEGEQILGNTHTPHTPARGVVLIAHGFLGYKDYGMFPRLASSLCEFGFIAHRFNYSHSGMTNQIDTFERPELFERDTWLMHQQDLDCVLAAIESGELAGKGLPLVLVGHSRGGVDVLLCAGRLFADAKTTLPEAVITLAAPDKSCMWDRESQQQVLGLGFIEMKSNRTGQTLRISADWLREQLDDPEAHDVLSHVERIGCPMLVIHGAGDPTVPAACARAIAAAGGERARLELIEGGDHVFNTPNPLPADSALSPQLTEALGLMGQFLDATLA